MYCSEIGKVFGMVSVDGMESMLSMVIVFVVFAFVAIIKTLVNEYEEEMEIYGLDYGEMSVFDLNDYIDLLVNAENFAISWEESVNVDEIMIAAEKAVVVEEVYCIDPALEAWVETEMAAVYRLNRWIKAMKREVEVKAMLEKGLMNMYANGHYYQTV